VGEAVVSFNKAVRAVRDNYDRSGGRRKNRKGTAQNSGTFRTARDIMPERIDALGVDPTAVLFGQNLVAENPGATINVGDEIEVIDSY
jgi:uncharacterized protein YcbX